MIAGKHADVVVLSVEDRRFLEAQVRRHKAPRSLSDRCRIVLLCAEGLQSKQVAERLGVHEHTVGKWRRRFVLAGIEGLTDEYRAGRPRTVSDTQVTEIIERTLNTTPKDATHLSIQSMAAEVGLSHTTIRRVWNALGLQPHRSETFENQATRCSSTGYKTLWVSTCRRRTGQSFCASMKRARSRRSTVSNRSCRWRRAWQSGEPTPTSAMAPRLCSQRSTTRRAL